MQMGEYEAALAALQKALALDAQRAQPYFLLGTLHEAQQQMGKAKKRYEKALELNQHHALAANNLAWIYLEVAGDVDRAWSLASRAYELAPQDPNVMDTMGWIYFKNSSYDRAMNLFKDAVSQKPGESIYHYHLGMTQFKMGAKKAARQALKKSLKLNLDHSEYRNAVEVLQVLGAG
jgi:tetratricopeptide (TPR) repeat protein